LRAFAPGTPAQATAAKTGASQKRSNTRPYPDFIAPALHSIKQFAFFPLENGMTNVQAPMTNES
jgi:hypothetical protein